MADFLAGFNLGDSSPGLLADDPSCTSFEDLQERLSHTIASKVTPTRAGRVSISLEFRAQARLTLDAAELDGDGNDLAALQAVVTGPKTKTIVVSQALSNQPQDNPVLQKAVAKRIVAAVAASDECAWTVREISRGSQGWTFTYICKDSTQQWQRQNAKESHMPVAGEYSNRAPDPRLMNRPAFDCRGSLSISFSRHNNSISISYSHTPMHKTVAQLTELYPPPERVLGPGAAALAQKQKTPKKAAKNRQLQPQLDENGNPIPKKKREPRPPKLDEDGNPIPKRKRPPPTLDEDGNPMPDEQGNPISQAKRQPKVTLDENGNPIPKKKREPRPPKLDEDGNPIPKRKRPAPTLDEDGNPIPKKKRKKSGGNAQDASASAEALAANPADGNMNGIINVTPEEATRRENVAKKLLSDGGVDPATLSAEQFSIFSNQSPDLQAESLSMLAKYGAERLRIVHPGNKESSTPANAPTAAPTTTKELVPQTQGSTPDNAAEVSPTEQDLTVKGTPRKVSRPNAKSRTACFSCKARRVKCPKERPTCVECSKKGFACEYTPQRERPRKSQLSEAVVEDDSDEDVDMSQDQEQLAFSNSQVPVADMLSTGMDSPDPNAQLRMQYPEPPDAAMSHTSHSNYSMLSQPQSLVLPTGQEFHTSAPPNGLVLPQQPHEAQQKPPTPRMTKSSAQSKRSRPSAEIQRDLPSGPPANSISPMMSVQTPANSSSRRTSSISRAAPPRANTPLGLQGGVQRQQSPMATAAMQAQGRASPFQLGDVSATSRQGQRSQTRTPKGASQGYAPPAQMPRAHEVTNTAATRQVAADLTDLAGYRSYKGLPEPINSAGAANSGMPSDRVNYEPYTQRGPTTAATSTGGGKFYPYDQTGQTPTTLSMSTWTETSAAPSQFGGGSHTGSWMGNKGGSYSNFNNSSSYSQNQNQNQRRALEPGGQQGPYPHYPSSQTQDQGLNRLGRTEAQQQGPNGWMNFGGLANEPSRTYRDP